MGKRSLEANRLNWTGKQSVFAPKISEIIVSRRTKQADLDFCVLVALEVPEAIGSIKYLTVVGRATNMRAARGFVLCFWPLLVTQ